MATRLTAQEIATQALRKIGELSPRDSSPSANTLSVALLWLDIVVSHLCGTEPISWVRPATVRFLLSAGKHAYKFGVDDEPSTRPESDVEFLSAITLIEPTGHPVPIKIIPLRDFMLLPQRGETGSPEFAVLDRATNTIEFDRVPAAVLPSLTDTGYKAEALVQSYALSSYTDGNSSTKTGLGAAWNLWAILATAYQIGGGPVRRLPASEREWMAKELSAARRDLLAFENKNHGTDRRVRFRQPM